MVRFVGLAVENEEEARRLYGSHDAFEFALMSTGSITQQMALDRRAGIIVELDVKALLPESDPAVDAHLITVSEPTDLAFRETE